MTQKPRPPVRPFERAPAWSELVCRVCGEQGVTIVAIGAGELSAPEYAWCGPNHARMDGWPYLRSESAGPKDAA